MAVKITDNIAVSLEPRGKEALLNLCGTVGGFAAGVDIADDVFKFVAVVDVALTVRIGEVARVDLSRIMSEEKHRRRSWHVPEIVIHPFPGDAVGPHRQKNAAGTTEVPGIVNLVGRITIGALGARHGRAHKAIVEFDHGRRIGRRQEPIGMADGVRYVVIPGHQQQRGEPTTSIAQFQSTEKDLLELPPRHGRTLDFQWQALLTIRQVTRDGDKIDRPHGLTGAQSAIIGQPRGRQTIHRSNHRRAHGLCLDVDPAAKIGAVDAEVHVGGEDKRDGPIGPNRHLRRRTPHFAHEASHYEGKTDPPRISTAQEKAASFGRSLHKVSLLPAPAMTSEMCVPPPLPPWSWRQSRSGRQKRASH